MRNTAKLFAVAVALFVLPGLAGTQSTATAKPSSEQPRFAFWYENWDKDTWNKLQPANVIIGISPAAVAEIHAHGGRALAYVTFYQSVFGTQFLKDASDLANVGFHTPSGFLPSAFGGKDNYVLCSNSAEVARRVLAYVDATIKQQGYDGLFIDNAYLPPAAGEICDSGHPHLAAGKKGGPAYIKLLQQVYANVKHDNPAAIVFTNSGNPNWASELKDGSVSLWDVSDYVLWESYGYSSLLGSGHDLWENTAERSAVLAAQPTAIKLVVLSYPRNPAEALYSYCAARIFGFNYAANLGESDLNREHEGGHFGIFVRDLPNNLGEPKKRVAHLSEDVLAREFNNGYIAVNFGRQDGTFYAPHRGLLHEKGMARKVKAGNLINVAPGSAVVIVYR